ncbi:MAG: 2-phosphosulfolactate phosphatase [Parachlamydiaceae bacterium]|nr:2-phosphosulfolactate phosphatase [Parachlamydiaceae bacterium]
MKIEIVNRFDKIPDDGVVVVIDVIRAFTTAAYAFAAGAEKILLVGSVDEALELYVHHTNYLLMGELEGCPIPEFHFSNSPVEISEQALEGRTLIQRTSSGTQGVVAAKHGERILVSSFVVAEATLRYILKLSPERVIFVVTGFTKGGDEDRALAEYLEQRLLGNEVDATSYLERVMASPSGQIFASNKHAHYPEEDLAAVLDMNRFNFAMEVHKEKGQLVLRPVFEKGHNVLKDANDIAGIRKRRIT